eukprot:6469541-Amphidinium_carterae.2
MRHGRLIVEALLVPKLAVHDHLYGGDLCIAVYVHALYLRHPGGVQSALQTRRPTFQPESYVVKKGRRHHTHLRKQTVTV